MSSKPQHKPRIICYHQTHYHEGEYVSMMPIMTEETGVTHLIIAAIHINARSGDITLNDDPWDSPHHDLVWEECKILQETAGIKILGMLGGAAKGSYTRLDSSQQHFESYYQPLRELILTTGLDGLDLDVEEHMSLSGIIRLILRLKDDFGDDFIITLAPVAPGMYGRRHISGFSYDELEKAVGSRIAWYNTQFYCGWGTMATPHDFQKIIDHGWPPEKIVCGTVTNSGNGRGYVEDNQITETIRHLRLRYQNFGGMFGWEYFNSVTTDVPVGTPWVWLQMIKNAIYPTGAAAAAAAAAAPTQVSLPENQLPSTIPAPEEGVYAAAATAELADSLKAASIEKQSQ